LTGGVEGARTGSLGNRVRYLINFESYTDFDGSLGGKITGFEVKEKALVVWLGWQLACLVTNFLER
jgi:hypothetical protein